jgi:hypothetical protein
VTKLQHSQRFVKLFLTQSTLSMRQRYEIQ